MEAGADVVEHREEHGLIHEVIKLASALTFYSSPFPLDKLLVAPFLWEEWCNWKLILISLELCRVINTASDKGWCMGDQCNLNC